MKRIYLDHAATSPLLNEAREAASRWLDCGNPSSQYEEGRRAKAEIDRAREVLSQALACLFAEVIFTSSGTEAANHAIIGSALAATGGTRKRILMGASEHHCVLSTEPFLRRLGFQVDLLSVDSEGRVPSEVLRGAIGDDVLLVSVMHANNELGTYNDIRALTEIAHAEGALIHVDAVQTFCVSDWTVDDLGADMISLSAHKLGGPKGVGALYLKAGTALKPLIYGGGQEREMRGGTENVAAISGFAAAVQHVPRPLGDEPRNRFEAKMIEAGAIPTVQQAPRLPGHCHVRFPGLDAGTLLIRFDREGISASSGAACSSGSVEPSHVLLACGFSKREASEGIRFSLGRTMGVAEAKAAADRVAEVVRAIRGSQERQP